jgi:hypothetical protein
MADRLVARQQARDREEAGLQDGIGSRAKPGITRDLRGVDDVEAQMLVDDRLLYRARQTIPDLVLSEGTVQQEDSAIRSEAQDVPSREECVLMTGDKARRSDQYGAWIGSGPKRRWEIVCAPDLWES